MRPVKRERQKLSKKDKKELSIELFGLNNWQKFIGKQINISKGLLYLPAFGATRRAA